MYTYLNFFHSIFRWLVLMSLLYTIIRVFWAHRNQLPFTTVDDRVRHVTATIVHIQFIVGILLYFQSPVVKGFLNDSERFTIFSEPLFFSMIHMAMMFISVALISIGSSKAKRVKRDQEKFATIMTYFIIALIIILLAIPWPFSPLAARPYLRTF